MLWKRDLNLTLNYWAAIFKWTYLRAPLELVGQMNIRKSVGKHSKSIGDVYGDARAANRVGIVWIFFSYLDFFYSDREIHDPDPKTHPRRVSGGVWGGGEPR